MPLTVKAESKTFDPVPEGVHLAVCYLIADLGTHYDEKWGKQKHEVRIGWEIPEERIEITRDGQKVDAPRVISQVFTLSTGEKANLRKVLEAWRGKKFTKAELDGFDLKNVLGKPCQLQVVHNHKGDKTYANVNAIMAAPRGVKAPVPENDIVWYSMEEGMDIPEGIYDWIQDRIKASQEYQNFLTGSDPNHAPAPEDTFPDEVAGEIPF